MGIVRELNKIRGGWPGGWKSHARGSGNPTATPPFVQPTDPDDRRSMIPPLGHRDYWYPALPAKDVGWKKPVALKICGDDIVFFRGTDGEVKALWDYCPHRGAYLSWGDCFFKGYVSCPYHGATFDGDGECVEFITEGPDSKMVGRMKAKSYKTITLKGVVFIWMGEDEPVDPKEDIPPEFFEDPRTIALYTFRYWHCNWMIGLENTRDSHNHFFVHRNAFRVMFSARGWLGGRPRTPLAYRTKIINGRSVTGFGDRETEAYYKHPETGKLPYKMYYPRVGGTWPLSSWRLSWVWAFQLAEKYGIGRRRDRNANVDMPEDWRSGMRLPGLQRVGFTRYCVPVEENLTRAIYFAFRRSDTTLGRAWQTFSYKAVGEWLAHFNFSDQDYDAMRSCRWQYPEYLSATDNHLVAERKLAAEYGRKRWTPLEVAADTAAERQVRETAAFFGIDAATDEGLSHVRAAEPIAVEVATGIPANGSNGNGHA